MNICAHIQYIYMYIFLFVKNSTAELLQDFTYFSFFHFFTKKKKLLQTLLLNVNSINGFISYYQIIGIVIIYVI